MPSQRILDALGMTPEQWGKLPPEPGTIGASNTSYERVELRKKALEIIRQEDELNEAKAVLAKEDRIQWAKDVVARSEKRSSQHRGNAPKEEKAEK